MSRSLNNTLFFYQRDKLVSLKQGTLERAILRNADMPLAEQQTGDASGAGLLATDDKGSVLRVQVDDEEEQHSFSAYGHAPNLPSYLTLLGFNGEHCYLRSGAYSLGNGHRAFHPTLMRFFSPDFLSPFAAGGLNAYAYCFADPINQIDPSGNIPQKIKKIANRAGKTSAAPEPLQILGNHSKSKKWVYYDQSTAPSASRSTPPSRRQLNTQTENMLYRSTKDETDATSLSKETNRLNRDLIHTDVAISQLTPTIKQKETAQLNTSFDKRKLDQHQEHAKYIRAEISSLSKALQKIHDRAYKQTT